MATVMSCGTGNWTGPLPGDPDNNSILSAVPAFGGIDVSWTYPNINPHAVAHVLLYRGISDNYAASVKQATVAGNIFYDRITGTAGTRYYYWIQIVSVNGTVGAAIGPASAIARSRIEDTIIDLSGKIEESALGTALRGSIGDITDNYNELLGKIGSFAGNNQAFMDALAIVQSGLTEALTLLNTEVTQRTSGQNALLSQQTVLAALNQVNVAAILEEQTVRVNADSALAQTVKELGVANTKGIAAAVKTIESSKIGYSGKATTEEPYEGNGSFTVYPVSTYPAVDFPEYAINRTRIIDKEGVINWNAGNALQLTWVVGLPLAQAVKSIGISDGTDYLTVEQRATAQKKTNGDLEGQWYVKVDAGGKVAGFGLSNTSRNLALGEAPPSRFIINADTFSISKPLDFSQATAPSASVEGKTWFNTNTHITYKSVKGTWKEYTPLSPFIVDSASGEVFINSAVINSLTIDKLRTADGGVLIQDGVIRIGSGIQDGATRNFNKGAWATNTAYTPGDSVVFEGNSWECRVSHTSSTTIKPPVYPVASNTQWNLLTVRGQGQVKGVAFTRSNAATVNAPVGGSFTSPNPTTVDWHDGIPADNNKPLWMSTCMFTSDGQSPQIGVNGTWSTPSKVGTPSTGTRNVFSVLGTTASIGSTDQTWHVVPSTLDIFMATQTSTDNGVTWGSITGSVRIKGENGKTGTSMDVQYSKDNSTWGASPTGAKYIRTGTKADGATVFTYSTGVKFVPELGTEYTVTNGTSAYLHIKYSNNGTSFTGNSGEDVGSWLGQYSDTTAADSTTFSDYTWKKIEGDKGETGPQGTTGLQGIINTNASYVLGAEGGFYTGTLARSGTAGSAWAVTGTGVTMTGNGIAAAKGGVPTFALNGATGDAEFAGTLSANKIMVYSGNIGANQVTVPDSNTAPDNSQTVELIVDDDQEVGGNVIVIATVSNPHATNNIKLYHSNLLAGNLSYNSNIGFGVTTLHTKQQVPENRKFIILMATAANGLRLTALGCKR